LKRNKPPKPLEPRRVGVGLTPRPEGRRADAEAAGRKGPPGSLGAEAEALKRHKPSFRVLRFKVESALQKHGISKRSLPLI